jgi:hypothetical protein
MENRQMKYEFYNENGKGKKREKIRKKRITWQTIFWEVLDKNGFLKPTSPSEVDWDKVREFIEHLIKREKREYRKKVIKSIYKFLFKDLNGEPLDNREAALVNRFPFVKGRKRKIK